VCVREGVCVLACVYVCVMCSVGVCAPLRADVSGCTCTYSYAFAPSRTHADARVAHEIEMRHGELEHTPADIACA